MNGDINGTMAEPKEDVLPSSPDSKADETKVTFEDCDENNSDCENSTDGGKCNTPVSEMSNGTKDSGTPKGSAMEVTDTAEKQQVEQTSEINCENRDPLSIDNVTAETHSENSNGSDPESTSSSQRNFKLKETELVNDDKSLKDDQNEGEQDSVHEDDMEYDSMAEGSAVSGEVRAEDTVSINSDSDSDNDHDETSQESQSKNRVNDIIILDGENRPGSNNSDVHEIDSDIENDDCVIDDEKGKDSNELEEQVQLRRSCRSIKRKRYTDGEEIENGEESDVEEVAPVDPLKRKSQPIVINDTKSLVAVSAKQPKADSGNNKKKETTVVIIDSPSPNKINSAQNSSKSVKNSVSSNSSMTTQNLYQSIVARGTTVTPVSNKNNNTPAQTSQNAPPPILPSLTDDMFVVEAPSFIVPYVYEKPSITAFREFVDKLGKQLEEEKLKEEIKEKEKREKEKKERKEKGEEVESDADETLDTTKDLEEEEASKKRKSKREQRRRNEEDDASWDGESVSDSDDELLSDENDKIVVKDKVEPIDQINVVADLTADKICSSKSSGKSSMDCFLGKFFINIGLNLVQEYVQSDLLKQQNRKLYKEKKAGHSTKATESSIAQLKKNLEFSKENNAPYSFSQEKCEFCSFKTESKLVMAQHLETPHMKNNVYKCNFCTFEIRSPHDILYHMESTHSVRGRLERAPSLHQCANCPFEDNGKGKLARHLIACAKKFKPDSNLAPPVDWEPPAKIPKIARPRNNVMSPYQNAFNRSQMGVTVRGGLPSGAAAGPGAGAGFRARGRSPMGAPRPTAPLHGLPILRAPALARPSLNMTNNFSVANNSKPKSQQPSISITPLPRHPTPNQLAQQGNNKNSFVICEICDGYIKDLEQLRNHMQWIHKVKIHPKMIYNRPPLNCQKCQFRFFTDQGFERHLLGSHGLVTSSMQEAANKGKDAGRCPVCGRVYQWKLLNHVARDHNLTLKPGHLSYKCTVCTATFGMYKQFENHVYSAHSVVAKRVIDKNKAGAQPAKGNNDTHLKPLKINEEITVIPQSIKSTSTKTAKDK